MFKGKGLVDIVVDRRPFPKELLVHQLDTALVACEEASYKVMDSLGGGQGQKARDLIQNVSVTGTIQLTMSTA